jgi:2-polyprenyl-3-methyl-5-hydroxy-6-metoxy-1,4-benzoquinol methylase
MKIKTKAKEAQNQEQFDNYDELPATLGPYTTHIWNQDPRHLGFLLSRYKFCAKMLEGKKRILEIGCGDAFGIPVMLQTVNSVHGVDWEPLLMDGNKERLSHLNCSFEVADITKTTPGEGKYDAAYSLDVIEHIPADIEDMYFKNICKALQPNGVFIMGTPNYTANEYASKGSQLGHINLKTHSDMHKLMSVYFNNVFVFSMNDEVVHTGFGPMAHYLIAVGVGLK